jgi:hypothetical protein
MKKLTIQQTQFIILMVATEVKVKLLNPYSIMLEKNPIMNVDANPVYVDGDFRIYKYYDRHFIHTYKNIVVSERGAQFPQLLTNLKTNTPPTGEASIYHDYLRPLEAMELGIKEAKKLNFVIK